MGALFLGSGEHLTTNQAIKIIERRIDFLSGRIAIEQECNKPVHLYRAEIKALKLALEELWERLHDEMVDAV